MRTASCLCCGCRRRPTISPPSSDAARAARGRRRATSCFSAPAARASAARRWRSSPACGAGARLLARRPAPALHGQSRSRHLCGGAGAAAARRHALRRRVEIRRHRRDPDADRRGAVGGAGRRPRRKDVPRLFFGITEPAVAGRRNGLRDLLAGHGVAMLDHDPDVGGRYSVLTNVGLLPAAMAGLDIAAVRRGAAVALAPILAGQGARRRSRPRSGRRSMSRSPPPGRSRSRC